MNRNTMLGLGLIIVLVSAKWFVVPWLSSVNENRAQIEQLEFTNTKLSQLPDRAKAAEEHLAGSVNLMNTLNGRSYTGVNPALISSAILTDINQLASQAGVTIRNQSLGEFKPGTINMLPLSAYVEGPVQKVNHFLALLEYEHEKQYLIESITIAKSRSGNNLKVNMKLFVMVVKGE